MRTKLILTTAAIGVAGSLGAFAQVYSVNAVGYINVNVPANGYALVANQLNSGGNTVNEVLGAQPEGTIVFQFGAAGFTANSYSFGAWDVPGAVLAPGQGFFVQNNAATPLTVTFVGEVPQGPLSTPMTANLNLVASQVPQAGKLQADLAFPAGEGDVVYQWDATGQKYKDANAFVFGGWDLGDPQISVGEGFFVLKAAAGNWTRNFSVN